MLTLLALPRPGEWNRTRQDMLRTETAGYAQEHAADVSSAFRLVELPNEFERQIQ
jgi:hypothetical protein